MAKKIVKLAFLGIVLLGLFTFFFSSRNLFFDQVLKGQRSSPLYHISPLTKALYKGESYKGDKGQVLEQFFQVFHLGHFLMKLPHNHPDYYLTPLLSSSGPKYMGLTIRNRSEDLLVEIVPQKSFLLEKSLFQQNLFQIPTLKKRLVDLKGHELWKMLFLEDISINTGEGFSLLSMGERFFIASLRSQYFKDSSKGLLYFPKNKIGVSIIENEKNVKEWKVYFLDQDLVRSFSVKWLLGQEFLRDYIISNMVLQEKDQRLGATIFQEFQNLSLPQKSSETGLIYLMSAWSQDDQNDDYLKTAIRYQERGQGSLVHLKSLYQYAYEKYGENFSKISGRKQMKNSVWLEKKIKEENEKRLREVEEKPRRLPGSLDTNPNQSINLQDQQVPSNNFFLD